MEYKITAILQSKGKFALFDDKFDWDEIQKHGDVESLYREADRIVIDSLIGTGINSAHMITVWRINIFGGWAEINR